MAASGVKLFPNRIAELTSQTGIVGRFVAGFTQDVVARAAIEAPVDTGRLSRSIRPLNQTYGANSIEIRIGSTATNPRNKFMYARAVHTGVRARSAKPGNKMIFKPRRSNRWVITAHVGPVHTNPYLTDALVAANRALPSGQKFRVTLKLDTRG